MDESPRYLAVVQKHQQAVGVLNRIARINKAQALNDEEITIVCNVEAPASTSLAHRTGILFGYKY